MKFVITRSSTYGDDASAPCDGAIEATEQTSLGTGHYYTRDFASLEELLAWATDLEEYVILEPPPRALYHPGPSDLPGLEIYDDYRE